LNAELENVKKELTDMQTIKEDEENNIDIAKHFKITELENKKNKLDKIYSKYKNDGKKRKSKSKKTHKNKSKKNRRSHRKNKI
jgi:hypothetical protein